MGPLSLPCFGRFASRTRVTSDKRDGASLDLILLTLAFRHTERKILPPHSIFIPAPVSPLLEIGWPPSGKDRKSLDVSFRPVGRSHTRCWGDNEPSEREADNKSFLLAPPHSFPPLLSITFSEKLQGHCSVRDVLMNCSPTSIYVMHNEMHFWRNCGIPPCIFPSQL